MTSSSPSRALPLLGIRGRGKIPQLLSSLLSSFSSHAALFLLFPPPSACRMLVRKPYASWVRVLCVVWTTIYVAHPAGGHFPSGKRCGGKDYRRTPRSTSISPERSGFKPEKKIPSPEGTTPVLAVIYDDLPAHRRRQPWVAEETSRLSCRRCRRRSPA